ncbi:cation:proton antiporter [Janibacter sp. Soil728]|uniref:monovalent cation/H(+) antiporter subunit G n=1 Tax=Janibacter sp. Soil728 TaxID=1736393 RepID=UPI0006FDD998|nr:monovalent cation/H(+) antiporter subunit G [Janibacter sp. Soil728]KRE36008.1 cation:proton antiporter [Janibacter sp. Soil728]
MTWQEACDLAGAISIFLGAVLALVGAIGLVRLPDIFARMHAATKPQTLGLLLILLGLALNVRTWASVATLLIVVGAQALTAPVTAHILGRAGYRTGISQDDLLHLDELGDAYRRMEQDEGTQP